MLAPIAPQQIVWQRARSPLRSPYSKATRLVLVADGRSAASGMPDEVHVIDESKMREKITEFGNSIARQQEADFLTAQERLLQAQADKSADQSDAAAPAARQTQPSTNDITAAVREELQRAKEYQNQLQNSAAATEDTACCPDLYDMDQTCAAGQTAGGGNAAAGFLANVLAKPASSPQSDIRPGNTNYARHHHTASQAMQITSMHGQWESLTSAVLRCREVHPASRGSRGFLIPPFLLAPCWDH